jgi:hypothetical protein
MDSKATTESTAKFKEHMALSRSCRHHRFSFQHLRICPSRIVFEKRLPQAAMARKWPGISLPPQK